MTPILKNIIVVIMVFVALFLGYEMFINGNTSFLTTTSEETAAQDELIAKTQDFISRREKLNSVTLDTSFLNDPRFSSLRSFSTPVPEQSVGKSNIFDKALSISSATVNATTTR